MAWSEWDVREEWGRGVEGRERKEDEAEAVGRLQVR